MPAVRDEAICIRHWDWSETSQTVTLFGRQLGLLRGLAKGARRERGSFGGGLDLLTRGEVGAILKPATELATLTDWELLETFPRLRDDAWANRTAWYAADLALRLQAPADPHPQLYDALLLLLRRLGAMEPGARRAPPAPALLEFQWMALSETGFQPALGAPGGREDGTDWFHPEHGGVIPVHGPVPPVGTWRVRTGTLSLLRSVAAGGLASLPAEPDATTVDRANRLLAAWVRHVLGTALPTQALLFGTLETGSGGGEKRPIG